MQNARSASFFISILAAVLTLQQLNAESFERTDCQYHISVNPLPSFEASYSVGQFIGINHNYADIGLLIPLPIRNSLYPFIDCRLYKFDSTKWGVSTGIGFRKNLRSNCVVGSNIFYDYLEGKFNKSFNRLGLGIEWFGKCLTLRLNTYISLGNRANSSKTTTYDDYEGDYYATCFEKEYSIDQGFDAEVGSRYVCWDKFTLYGGIGPYHFTSKKETSYFGGQFRLEAYYSSYISFQIRSSYDSINRSQTQGRIQLTLPFDIFYGKLRCICNTAISQPVRRNGIIFTDECCHYDWNW